MRLHTLALTTALALALAGCGSSKTKPTANSLDAMDEALVNGAVADGNSVAGAIKVDPAKVGQPAAPATVDRPATTSLADVAQRQAAHQPGMPQGEAPVAGGASSGSDGDCTSVPGLGYANGWAAKLPADLPMMPGATLTEAAGRDTPCVLRIVSFSAPGNPAAVIAWYAAKARDAGYSVDRADKDGDIVLAGTRGDAVYYIMIGATSVGRTSVDYIWQQD